MRKIKTISPLPLIFIPLFFLVFNCEKDKDITITDIDGNVYHTVPIGTQLWMIENLKTTKYNDGSDIPLVEDPEEWADLLTPAYCWYDNNNTYKHPYGALYNSYVIETDKLCPEGWHVPTNSDWGTLINYLEEPVGGKLKEYGTVNWKNPNTNATNETGFTALPGGYRTYFTGEFWYINDAGYWWTSTEFSSDYSWNYSYRNFVIIKYKK